MDYTVFFDVIQSGYRQWWFPAFGLLFVGITTWEVFIRRRSPTKIHLFFARFGFGFSLFWTAVSFLGTFSDYYHLSSELREGRCDVVEGTVTDFDPMPEAGHRNESFVVAGQRFFYSDYEVTAGFNNTASHGGPIHQGLRVRIHSIGNKIARLEIVR